MALLETATAHLELTWLQQPAQFSCICFPFPVKPEQMQWVEWRQEAPESKTSVIQGQYYTAYLYSIEVFQVGNDLKTNKCKDLKSSK